MNEDDYEAIHAAVVETVRGRWFLDEFARRSRLDEVREMLGAVHRLEAVVTNQRALPPPEPMPPHARLLVQRAEEIAAHLSGILADLRGSGADATLCEALETQVRAVAALSPERAMSEAAALMPPVQDFAEDPRHAGLARLDALPLAEKLALFG